MTRRTLIRRNLRFHWRSHLGVWLGALIGTAALVGALVVGESVRESLRERGLNRVGSAQLALDSRDRLFNVQLTRRFEQQRPPIASPGESGSSWNGLIVPLLHVQGTVATQDDSARANHVNVYGVNNGFWSFSPRSEISSDAIRDTVPAITQQGEEPTPPSNVVARSESFREFTNRPKPGEILINQALAAQLQVRNGTAIVLRFSKPSSLSQDAVLNPRDASTAAFRAVIGDIVDPAHFGDFSLRVGQQPPLNAFLNEKDLWRLSGVTNQANLMLVRRNYLQTIQPMRGLRSWLSGWGYRNRDWLPRAVLASLLGSRFRDGSAADSAVILQYVTSELKRHWRAEDVGINVHAIEQPASATGGEYIRPMIEVSSRRIFLDQDVGEAALMPRTQVLTNRADFPNDGPKDVSEAGYVTNGIPLITYLVNAIQFGDHLTPYSMVTAVGAPWTPTDMADDEIIVNEWLASDLEVNAGDQVSLSYYDPESGARLVEKTNTFTVRAIVPMRGLYADRTLMPDFPGVATAESTGDWDTGFPLVHTIRDQDETYWKQHRGTPKAFITLNAGRKLWANRFGEYTAIRYPIPTNGIPSAYRNVVEANLVGQLDPSQLGLVFQPVREQALKAANESQDFGGLFIGFSFFLIVAALLLMAMLFAFGVEQRAAEIGTYLAVGFPLKQVRRLFLREGVAIAVLGALVGTVAGVEYAKGMLWGLTTIWRSAVGTSSLGLHYTISTLFTGAVSGVVVAALAIWLTLRKQGAQPVRELLAGGAEELDRRTPIEGKRSGRQRKKDKVSGDGRKRRRSRGWWVGIISGVLGLATVGYALAEGEAATADTFFSAGSLILIAGLGFVAGILFRLARLGESSGTVSPHPDPLPREREQVAGAMREHPVTQPASGLNPILPLPGGEGRGEGKGGVALTRSSQHLTLTSLGIRGCARRRNRSLAVAAMLACACFLILSIGAFRLDADRDAGKRSAGTGGFTFIGETSLPVLKDLNTQAGRDNYGLNEADLHGVSFVPFRVREGDEASCLNLNRAQHPRLLGVNPELLAERDAFTFAQLAPDLEVTNGWQALIPHSAIPHSAIPHSAIPHSALRTPRSDIVPAIGDAAAIQWAMGKKIGDTIDYTDERGQPFRVKIVGAVANSILQGNLIIDEAEFIKHFPSAAGHRYFLVDAPTATATHVSAVLSRALSDVGLELVPAARRLAQFNAVQNTYLNTFQVLGGLGLLLGSVGLGVVVLRNVLERRGELALLLAVGFTRSLLARMILVEHLALLLAGLVIGLVAAVVSVLPALISPGAEPPSWSLIVLLAAVLLNGLIWTWLATRWAMRGRLLEALRNE